MKKEFGSIVPNGGYLHIQFRYLGERVRLSSSMVDLPENHTFLRIFLNDVGEQIDKGVFNFSNTFPDAPRKQRNKIATREKSLKGNIAPQPDDVTLSSYITVWMASDEFDFLSPSSKIDFANIINSQLKKKLGEMTFLQLTSFNLKSFVSGLKHEYGKNIGLHLSAKRMRNIMYTLRTIYRCACSDYGWMLKEPFDAAFDRIERIDARRVPSRIVADDNLDDGSSLEEIVHNPRQVLLLAEFKKILQHIDPWYHPVFELMLRGMIFSELKGLQKRYVKPDHIKVISSIARYIETGRLKTKFRRRKVPLTSSAKELIDQAMSCSAGDYVHTMKNISSKLNYSSLRKLWMKAVAASGFPHYTMYCLRHTFIEWSLLVGVLPSRLRELAGHADLNMINKVYGGYREGLLKEREEILMHLGVDFLKPEELKLTFPHLYNALYTKLNSAETLTAGVDASSDLPKLSISEPDATFSLLAAAVADNYISKAS